MKKIFAIMLFGGLIGLSSCNKDDDKKTEQPKATHIMAVAEGESDLSLFVEAVNKAGLASKLSGGSYTVFAPTDAAFQAALADLGASDIDALIQIIGTDAFKTIIEYHILKSELSSDNIVSSYMYTEAKNTGGNFLSLYISKGATISINNIAQVQEGDVEASNGVIHKVNTIIRPATIAKLLQANPSFSNAFTLMAAAAGDLAVTLDNPTSNYTFIAPDNLAFTSFFMGKSYSTITDMINDYTAAELQDILLYHTLPGVRRKTELTTGTYSTSLTSKTISVTNDSGGNITISDGTKSTTLIFFNITAINGVVHIPNNVLEP